MLPVSDSDLEFWGFETPPPANSVMRLIGKAGGTESTARHSPAPVDTGSSGSSTNQAARSNQSNQRPVHRSFKRFVPREVKETREIETVSLEDDSHSRTTRAIKHDALPSRQEQDDSTESDESEPPSRGVSFAFSHIESRNASMTSLSSTSSIDSTTGRKRTAPYVDRWSDPIVTTTPKKALRTARRTSPSHPVPQTPSRPTRQPVPPPTSSTTKQTDDTPTLGGVCKTFSQNVGLANETTLPTLDDAMLVDADPQTGVHIVAHSTKAQQQFDTIPLEWGVQYELARGVSNGWWSWEQVAEADLRALSGPNNNAASKVAQVVLGQALGSVSSCDPALWAELDREEAALRQGRSRGLGLQGDWMEKPNWYGGQIQQVARLQPTTGSYRLVLTKMEMRKSHRFARFLGSRRILQVSVPSAIVNGHAEKLRMFFSQKFVLCGRMFVAFGTKDSKAFLMEVLEDYERTTHVPGDEQRISLDDFVAWHNPLALNGKQPVSKWATRFDLGFSISVPALSFPVAKAVFHIGDEYASYDQDKYAKAPAECTYTDGCGYMNGAALSAIARQVGLEERPTAVQGRIAGAKGLWVLHPREQSATPKIWIRQSQRKITLDFNNLHPAHCIFDLLQPPRVTIPSRLSRLTILNLAHNGVPTQIFVDLMEDTIEAEVQPLTQWDGPKAMPLLWRAVEKVGGVSIKRAMQHALGTTRALGVTSRIREDDDTDDPVDVMLKELVSGMQDQVDGDDVLPSVTSLRDQVTGEPLTIHAVVMDLLQAGFQPKKLEMLYDKLKKIVTNVIEDIIRDYHISVPLSAEAFIVPDPYGVLEEGEIHFKTSTKDLKDPREDPQPKIILGDVLIYRNPNRLPSDVRKVKAVQHEMLAEYTNVIVLPTKGPCSFASVLAGGDYDGDVCVCIYDPKIVENFKNSEISRAPETFLKDNFENQDTIQQVSDMADELNQLTGDRDARRRKLQESLLGGLSTPPIGLYSLFHENAAYMYGYDAPETIRNAFMFNTVLDSRKTGLRVTQEVLRRDKLMYHRPQPECLKSTKSTDEEPQSNMRVLRRGGHLPRFVLDELFEAGGKMRDAQLKRYDKLVPNKGSLGHDPDLQPPRAIARLIDHPQYGSDLVRIKAHIDACIKRWQDITKATKAAPKKTSKGAAKAAGKSQRAKWDELSREFAAGPRISSDSPIALFGNLEELKASWAYAVKPNFAWKVAFQTLCRIKAKSRKPVAFTEEFAELMSIGKSAERVLEQSRLVGAAA